MATTSKKATSKSLAGQPKPESMTVEFIPNDAADQSLLAAIKEELAAAGYSNFGDLCKDALQQFLFESETDESLEPDEAIDPAVLQFQQQLTDLATTVNQSLATLQQQMQQMAQTLAAPDPTLGQQLATQLTRIEAQVERIATTQVTSASNSDPEAVTSLKEGSNPALGEERSPIADPMLLRLSALLEEF